MSHYKGIYDFRISEAQRKYSVQLLSLVCLFETPWTAAHHASLSNNNSPRLPKLMYIDLVMPSNHLILCRLLLFLPSIFPSIRVFSNESALRIKWPKYYEYDLDHTHNSKEHPGLISFRMVGSPCSPRDSQESSSTPQLKASILWCSAFFTIQLSHPYMTTGKTIALTKWTFVGKVMSLLFNMLPRLVITFLPTSKRL